MWFYMDGDALMSFVLTKSPWFLILLDYGVALPLSLSKKKPQKKTIYIYTYIYLFI